MIGKLSGKEVLDIVDTEGLGYSLLEYLGTIESDDLALQDRWNIAYDALWELDAYLEHLRESYS